MWALVGLAVVAAAVFGGFLLERGEPLLLFQPAEFLIIWGAGLGSMVIATPMPVLRRVVSGLRAVLRPSRFTRELHLDTLRLFYELFHAARRQGLMALEKDIERPSKSEIFGRHPRFLADRDAVVFVCDTLRLAVSGGVSAHDLDMLTDSDIEVHSEHKRRPVDSLLTVADALPGLGIVAAVLGIVIAMSSLGGPPEELGQKVAAALVGTFLGVLSSYGFVAPLAGAMAARDEQEDAYYRVLQAGLIAFVKGNPPILAAEFARRRIPHDVRPSFSEMEQFCKR